MSTLASRRRACGLLLLALLGPALCLGEPGEHSASPYFAIEGADPTRDNLPLKSTRVDARILGVIADVRVIQQYRNEGSRPLEARYVFPGSTRAAVYGMRVRLGERELQAQIRERQKAQLDLFASSTACFARA